ncbi:MAG: hypothetical protein KJ718_01700 [Nanoarchaeota archaeon]|nr:hypothetical protein [Nanoarchaeota archaeon]
MKKPKPCEYPECNQMGLHRFKTQYYCWLHYLHVLQSSREEKRKEVKDSVDG